MVCMLALACVAWRVHAHAHVIGWPLVGLVFGSLEIIAALQIYQNDRVVIWRESSAGLR